MKKFTLLSCCLLLVAMVQGQVIFETNDQQAVSHDPLGSNINDLMMANDKHYPENINLLESAISSSSKIKSQNNREYYERLFYTCKVWGFVKYFHSKTASCSINLDSILIQKLPAIEAAANNVEFNEILLSLINSPGETALPTTPLPVIPDSLMYNLNLEWIQSEMFSQEVKDVLDTIRVRFRPRSHCLVGEAFAGGNPTFDADILYNSGSGNYPDENLRILALFRYWNILNYFYPYKNIMDQDWDTTLTEVIPLFAEAQSSLDYDKAILVIAKRINDSHAFTFGGVLNNFFGANYPRFACSYIENETVITKVDPSVTAVRPGDIIRFIDGIDIEALRDSIELYTKGSNDLAIASYVHDDILQGPYGNFNITIENESGTNQYTLQRNWNYSQFNNFVQNTGPVWYDTVINQTCHFGYVDMGRLTTGQVATMMTDLWHMDAIIFDIRSYPQQTLWSLVNYLFTQPIHIANFTAPDVHYPGVLSWLSVFIGSSNPIVYTGRLIILFDIRTISQAEYTCMGLEQHPGSIKIGSRTKAADGNVSLINLPGSITTYFTGLGTFYPDYTPTQRIGIIPDTWFWPTIEGIRQGKDEMLEYALNCALVSVEENSEPVLNLSSCPNPFLNSFRIEYSLLQTSEVWLELYDMSGRQVSVIVDETQTAGTYMEEFDGSDLKAGLYYCRLTTGDQVMTKKIIKMN